MSGDAAEILRAGDILRSGGLVAFPTETVYGLGGDATNDHAVARIFEAKGRPSFNPLIVHLPDAEAAERVAVFDERARRVAAAFWPGPLTLVLIRRDEAGISRLVSAGLPSVALRVPRHPLAIALLQAAGKPIAGPSANRSGQLSPTTAAHVRESLGGRIDGIVDGGPCGVGLESTVLDLTTDTPVILRPGGVTPADLAAVLGMIPVLSADDPDAPKSPGQLASHYAPGVPVRLDATQAHPGEALLGFGGTAGAVLDLSPGGDLIEAAAHLFAYLHDLDDSGQYNGIAVAPIPDQGLGMAINDRLRRAAAPR